jgi:MFS family permease
MAAQSLSSDNEVRPMSGGERKVILASSLGTVFEWYDFYLYGSLAAVIGAKFFSQYDEITRNIFALLAFAAGFLVRPFGALVFGRLGDLVGRKHTFLITILIMGSSTFIVGVLPTSDQIGFLAPTVLIALRLLQGLALGGEYGGAATYVAEHAPHGRRGFYTSWIQTTATMGLFLSLLVILTTQSSMSADDFRGYGWRVPFLVSILLLAVSVWIRMQLSESPAFLKMKAEGTALPRPVEGGFRPVAQRPMGAAGTAGAGRGPGRGLVFGPVLRAVLPHLRAEGGRVHGQPARRLVARHRHRRIRAVWLAVRQDRA